MKLKTNHVIMPLNILVEVSVRIAVLTIVYIMHNFMFPYIRYITEKEYNYTYKKLRKESLTPPWVMILVVVFVPLIFFSLHAILTHKYEDFIHATLSWTLAIIINAFITELVKIAVGRPRPDFFYRCFPDGMITNTYICTGTISDVTEGRKSFPSGHSSFSFCSLGFISIWLCGSLGVMSRCRGHGLFVVTCLIPLLIACIISLSRYCDNHHHWDDILVGSMIGFLSSYFCYRQYYHPLDSNLSGTPYFKLTTECECFNEQCCSKDLCEQPDCIQEIKQ